MGASFQGATQKNQRLAPKGRSYKYKDVPISMPA